jgi:hypothetical protein
MSKPIKDVLNQDEDSSNYSMNELIFISAQPKQEITKEVLNGTNMLGTRSAGQKTEHPADELAFISQDSPKEEEIEDAGSKRNEDKLVVDELKLNIESSISIETKSNGSNEMSTTSNLSTDQKNPSPIKHITAVFVFSAIAVLMTFANLRIGLRLFCP